ncbi:sensor histidine kinase [Streptomyces sp. NPDC002889]|uniref:sensor histidine kinase n=1 Tax=Streptomyces sp. NPDC002889 TaxID=3364669 RepID=UPI00368122B7
MRRRWSLRTRLVVSAVALIAVVAAVIGTVTWIAFRTYLYGQLDTQLSAVAARAAGRPGPPPDLDDERPPGVLSGKRPLDFVTGGGAPVGTVGALIADDGTITDAVESTEAEPDVTGPTAIRLSPAAKAALAVVPRDDDEHTVELPGRGDYRVTYSTGERGSYLVGIPTDDVQNALGTLVVVELSVTGAGLIAAGIAGASLVGVALRPLRRVASTARRVSELPLHSGEVALHERVPDAEADPRTEVGQVGAALNRMLGHVGSALAARQESETRVRQFVADASHELRTPLASIRGYAELTRRGRERSEAGVPPGRRPWGRDTVGPDTLYALGRIEAEAIRMTGLVEDLLLLARLDAGRPLSYETTDLFPLVVDAVADARAAGQDHRWRLELPAEPATVRGDAARLHQVLVNLLGNARAHTPPGTTVTARVRTGVPGTSRDVDAPPGAVAPGAAALPGRIAVPGRTVVPAGAGNDIAPTGPGADPGRAQAAPLVVLEIEDDGPGIPPALLPHVFERFARGDASRSRHAGSTGLGLAIVQAVVAAHGGKVTVRSVPGRTVFGIGIPAAPVCMDTSGDWAAFEPADVCAYDSQTGHRLSTQP